MKHPLGLLSTAVTSRQIIVIALWWMLLAGILAMGIVSSYPALSASWDLGAWMHAIGMNLGLLAAFFALTQFMLMGRILWIERTFGADHLAQYHRFNGYAAITLIILHPEFMVYAHMLENHSGYVQEYLNTLASYPFTPLALVGQILFVLVALSSIYLVRRHLKFENWYYVHLVVYAAIILAFFHQVVDGDTFTGNPTYRLLWYALYTFVALNIVIWRLGVPLLDAYRHRFRVQSISPETATVTSAYLKADGLPVPWAVPGQFVFVRFLAKGFWKEEHPFSLSRLPDKDGIFRISVRHVGDYTNRINTLPVGARAIVSRPFGRFTLQTRQTDKLLLIAGGIGITPLLPIAAEAASRGLDTTLLYANTLESDVPLKAELDALASKRTKIYSFYSRPSTDSIAHTGYITLERIRELTPDFIQRDIYICGPPVMMYPLVDALLESGVSGERLHYERFALHDQRKKSIPMVQTRPNRIKTS